MAVKSNIVILLLKIVKTNLHKYWNDFLAPKDLYKDVFFSSLFKKLMAKYKLDQNIKPKL